MTNIDIAVEDDGWAALGDADALARRAVGAALAGAKVDGPVSVSLLLANDAAVRALNREWRREDKPTNVLSFPAPPGAAAPGPAGAPRHLGDVVLAFETVAKEAAVEGKTLADHAAHLLVHGVLHLLGHDHGAEGDAAAMEALEVSILAGLGVADPYRDAAA